MQRRDLEKINAELLSMLKQARECIAWCRRHHDDVQKGDGVPIEVFIDDVISRAEVA